MDDKGLRILQRMIERIHRMGRDKDLAHLRAVIYGPGEEPTKPERKLDIMFIATAEMIPNTDMALVNSYMLFCDQLAEDMRAGGME